MSHGRESRRLALPWPAARSSNAGYSPVSPKPSNLSPGNAVNTPVVGASRALRSTSFIVITALVMTIGSFARESWHLPLRSSEPAVIGTVQRPDYYAQPGTIVVKKDSVRKYESARFLSMDNAVDVQSRKQTGLESTLQLGDGWDDLQALQRAVKFDHLTNKTVVLLGDSVDRFFVDHLCQDFLPSSELTYNALHVAPADLSPITSPDSYYDEFSEPHLCTLPEHLGGLKIWSVMFYGVLTKDDEEWSFKDQTRSPRRVEDKLRLFSQLLARRGEPEPDLVITHSGLWDLATSNIRDVRANAPNAEVLTLDTISTLRSRTIDLLTSIKATWPASKIMYRTIHNVLAQTAGDWFLEHLPLPPSGKPYAKTLRVPMATSKIWQINALTQSLAQEAGKATYNASLPAVPAFTVFDLAKVTQAYTGDFTDFVHPQGVGLVLYAQMLLYYLRVNLA
ncbi:hypothetical protein EMMF5_005597 [Cystobasidiomycetes sp. EMM_F5]